MKQTVKKMVIFGAGKIGRSFIGQLFSAAGYEVVFIDINNAVIEALNQRREYDVVVKADIENVIKVRNVRGVNAAMTALVAEEVASADIVAVSVGLNALQYIAAPLAAGLVERFKGHPDMALDIIIAENMRDAAPYMATLLGKHLPKGFPLNKLVGMVETSIGKMVPIMTRQQEQEDILRVYAEPYNTLILDKKGFRNPIPNVAGLDPKENMKPWVDRKLFIHNLGHATAAYLGFQHDPRMYFLWEVLEVKKVREQTRATMLQAADVLLKAYPGEFTYRTLLLHVDDLLTRFRNQALGDTVFRVGCDLQRKLGPDDRLTGAIRMAIRIKMPYDLILKALIAGVGFRATDEEGRLHPSDDEFSGFAGKGIAYVLQNVCGFDPASFPELFSHAMTFSSYLEQ